MGKTVHSNILLNLGDPFLLGAFLAHCRWQQVTRVNHPCQHWWGGSPCTYTYDIKYKNICTLWWAQLYWEITVLIIKFQSKNPFEKMAWSNFDFDTRIMNVIQTTHHPGDIRYGMPRDIECSCMSLISVCWTLFKSASIWDSFNVDCILKKWIFCLNLLISTDV